MGFVLLAGDVAGVMSVNPSLPKVDDRFLSEKLELLLNFSRERVSYFPKIEKPKDRGSLAERQVL